MTDDVLTVAERYVSATQSSNLRCETGDDAPMGDTAILIAAGWSASRIGAALMRLQTKIDRTTLEQVHEQLSMRAEGWSIAQPVTVAASVLGWWLAKTCRACNGVKFELIPNTPALSTKACKLCRGSGEAPLLHGDAGNRMARFIDECVERGQASIRSRLRATR
jgi:hypothetical protein